MRIALTGSAAAIILIAVVAWVLGSKLVEPQSHAVSLPAGFDAQIVSIPGSGHAVDFSIVCRLFQQGCRRLVCDAASKSVETGAALMRQRPFLGLGLQAQQGFHGVQRRGFEQ
jgi:hypothetical protein